MIITALRKQVRRLALATALLGTVAIVAAQPAMAVGTTGSMAAAPCGWHLVLGPADPYKITTATFPKVSGPYASSQPVDLLIEFQTVVSGHWQTYRSGWFYTYAHAGAWSSTWTAFLGGAKSTQIDDYPGESGYATGDAGSGFTSVVATVYWFNGKTVVGHASQNERNALYDPTFGPYICNAGQNYA